MQTIETTGVGEHAYTFLLPNGKKIHITKLDSDFFEKLRELPYQTKIVMMQLTEEEMSNYIADKKSSATSLLKNLFTKKWYWRTTGEKLPKFYDYHIDGFDINNVRAKNELKRGKLTLKQIYSLIDWYTGTNSEVYAPK